MSEFRYRMRVPYSDTDIMGIAHHSSYVVWLENARTEWMRQRGKTYRQVEADGIFLQVVGLSVRYRSSATYDDLLEVLVREKSRRRVGITLEYEVRMVEEDRLVATAETELASTDRGGKVRRLPEGV